MQVVLRCVLVFLLSYGISSVITIHLESSFIDLIISCLLSITSTVVIIVLLGMEKDERILILNKLMDISLKLTK